jgi:hypothetical protein
MYKTYVLNVAPGADLAQVEYHVQTDPRIASYWNYLPYLFCVKTQISTKELAELFANAAPSFFIAEIVPANVNGRLPKAAWEWFNAPVERENALSRDFRHP